MYPAATPFIRDWAESVERQEDRGFDLWIALDALRPEEVQGAAHRRLDARWVTGVSGDTPATVRARVIERVVREYEAVVFVDCDDVLLPGRVAAARQALQTADAVACRIDLVSETGSPIGASLPARPPADLRASLPISNMFGLSNTAYASNLLARCLPIPRECVLVDWFLATRALFAGGRLAFDPRPGMLYRQHASNTARVGPCTSSELGTAAGRVRQHHEVVLATVPVNDPQAEPWRRRLDEIKSFQRFLEDSRRAEAYVLAFNHLELEYHWWESVADPRLEQLWR